MNNTYKPRDFCLEHQLYFVLADGCPNCKDREERKGPDKPPAPASTAAQAPTRQEQQLRENQLAFVQQHLPLSIEGASHEEESLDELMAAIEASDELNETFNTPAPTRRTALPRARPRHPQYFKDVSHLDIIDVYRVLELFKVTDHAIGHAVKKLLCAGLRGSKPVEQDVQEALTALTRWVEMRDEDEEGR